MFESIPRAQIPLCLRTSLEAIRVADSGQESSASERSIFRPFEVRNIAWITTIGSELFAYILGRAVQAGEHGRQHWKNRGPQDVKGTFPDCFKVNSTILDRNEAMLLLALQGELKKPGKMADSMWTIEDCKPSQTVSESENPL